MNKADNNVNTYACKAATNISNTDINNTKAPEIGETATVSNIKINENKLKIIMCPAVIFAKRRIIKAKGFVSIPISSTGTIIGASHTGTPGVLKICPQYDLLPLKVVMIKVINANTKVK